MVRLVFDDIVLYRVVIGTSLGTGFDVDAHHRFATQEGETNPLNIKAFPPVRGSYPRPG